MERLTTTWGEYTLNRFPIINNDSLRAWDAADEYILHHLAENNKGNGKNTLLIINDTFGALAVSLNELAPDCWSDSYLSQLATTHNMQQNQLSSAAHFIPSTATPEKGKVYDTVIIKIPKTIALLEEQLIRLTAHITPDTRIIAAAMSKHIHSSTLRLFEKIIGSTKTSLAMKKARLIFSHYEKTELSGQSMTLVYPKNYVVDEFTLTLVNHANVFAKDKLDRGSRLLIQQFNALPKAERIIDLGCGNGVLGIMAQRALPNSELCFVDESYMALASAKASYTQAYPDKKADFLLSDGLSQYQANQAEKVDLILCNPPFHQEHATGEHLAWRMFEQSLIQLKQGGQLWVVANRHLNHHSKLKRLLGNSRLIASNKTFVVLMAKKR